MSSCGPAYAQPLATRLRELWSNAERNGLSHDECAAEEARQLDEFVAHWRRALLLPGDTDLTRSILRELGRWRGIDDLEVVRGRCTAALADLKRHWQSTVAAVDGPSVGRYYDTADLCIEELMWWHTLEDDRSPLAYVAALEVATGAGGRRHLDFGSGVGSGALLFHDHGFDVTLADVSSVLLAFSRQRFATRGRPATFLDLKQVELPPAQFDFITAMDVFEHLVDPVGTVDALDRALKPGGYIYGRFAADADDDRPQHIVHDFGPVLERFHHLGFEEAFRDDWLWGHLAFRKPL
ncbi:MAG TPA: class I SAM-dependent methyltransferase [Candidatus Dormibacteraeota bacterium]|nr:class I SAM-dependent methyltransferase [Candidatus Dormibacteraeota bacterium]